MKNLVANLNLHKCQLLTERMYFIWRVGPAGVDLQLATFEFANARCFVPALRHLPFPFAVLFPPPSPPCSCIICQPNPAHYSQSCPPPSFGQITKPVQVQGSAYALQMGVDALLLRPDSELWAAGRVVREQRNTAAMAAGYSAQESNHSEGAVASSEVVALNRRSAAHRKSAIMLSTATVTRSMGVGIGDRVCVDMIQNLAAGEGMLVGSSAKLLALVHAETFETEFVPAR